MQKWEKNDEYVYRMLYLINFTLNLLNDILNIEHMLLK